MMTTMTRRVPGAAAVVTTNHPARNAAVPVLAKMTTIRPVPNAVARHPAVTAMTTTKKTTGLVPVVRAAMINPNARNPL